MNMPTAISGRPTGMLIIAAAMAPTVAVRVSEAEKIACT